MKQAGLSSGGSYSSDSSLSDAEVIEVGTNADNESSTSSSSGSRIPALTHIIWAAVRGGHCNGSPSSHDRAKQPKAPIHTKDELSLGGSWTSDEETDMSLALALGEEGWSLTVRTGSDGTNLPTILFITPSPPAAYHRMGMIPSPLRIRIWFVDLNIGGSTRRRQLECASLWLVVTSRRRDWWTSY